MRMRRVVVFCGAIFDYRLSAIDERGAHAARNENDGFGHVVQSAYHMRRCRRPFSRALLTRL